MDFAFAIVLKSEKKVIGGVGLDGINYSQGTAGGGIWINEKYHGRGYGTEAYTARINFAFGKIDLRRIENGYFKGNKGSASYIKLFPCLTNQPLIIIT